jgi:hypothetical protein
MILKFNLDALPPLVSIVSARLTLPLAETPIDSARISVYNIRDDWSETAASDSLALSAAPTDSRFFYGSIDSLDLSIGKLAQSWADGTAPNNGVAVRFADELAEPRSIPLHTREATDPLLRPRLEIVFLRPVVQPPWGGEP